MPGMVIVFEDISIFLSVLAQRLHVTHDRIQVRVAQLHGGHQRTGFDCTGVLYPKTEVVVSVCGGACGDRGAAHQMRKVRAKASIRGGSPHRMAVHASIGFKDSPARDCAWVFDSGLLLSANPGGKILRPIHRNPEQHLRVLGSAVLGTLAKKDACALRIHPHSVGVIRNEVGLACKLRHPKAVVGIGRKQLQKSWCRMTGIAYWDVQFVGCDYPQLRISKLPPVLMSNRGDMYSARPL